MNAKERKEFYLSRIFDGYVEKMPFWLKYFARQEEKIISDIVYHTTLGKRDLSFLDFGCGNCRVFDFPVFNIFKMGDNKFVAADVFKEEELPDKFKEKLASFDCKYLPLGLRISHDTRLISPYLGRHDIIIALGVDENLDLYKGDYYRSALKNCLKPNGILIWQTRRDDTFWGKILKRKDKELGLFYISNYVYKPYITKRTTGISNIYVY